MEFSHRPGTSVKRRCCFDRFTRTRIVVKRSLSVEHGGPSVDDAVICRQAVCSNHQVPKAMAPWKPVVHKHN